MVRQLSIVALAIACALLSGCSSDDSPTSPSGNNGGIKTNPSFATDIQDIFNRKGCVASNCHGTATAGSLDLRAGTAYSQLVGVAAVQEAGTRVIVNDAQNSYLVIKVENRQTAGTIMPATGTPLDSIDIQNIRNWIDTGALDN